MRIFLLAAAALAASATTASANILPSLLGNIANVRVEENELTAKVNVAGVGADLSVRFEDATGLSLESLGLSATLINPLDPSLLNRLPTGALDLAAGLPLMITIDPPADGGLSFEGLVEIELYTTHLHYVAGSPLRIYGASKGAAFEDITDLIAGGSYRTRGTKGRFSDFLVLADLRPLPTILASKFDKLDRLLLNNAALIDTAAHGALVAKAGEARQAFNAARYGDAITAVAAFEDLARTAGENGKAPNTWSASGGPRNVAGELRAAARTLRFSLTLAANGL